MSQEIKKYRLPATNKRFIHIEVEAQIINVWYEEPNNGPHDEWWDITIKDNVIEEVNDGIVNAWCTFGSKTIDHKIKTFFELSQDELITLINYFADTRRHDEWKN